MQRLALFLFRLSIKFGNQYRLQEIQKYLQTLFFLVRGKVLMRFDKILRTRSIQEEDVMMPEIPK